MAGDWQPGPGTPAGQSVAHGAWGARGLRVGPADRVGGMGMEVTDCADQAAKFPSHQFAMQAVYYSPVTLGLPQARPSSTALLVQLSATSALWLPAVCLGAEAARRLAL